MKRIFALTLVTAAVAPAVAQVCVWDTMTAGLTQAVLTDTSGNPRWMKGEGMTLGNQGGSAGGTTTIVGMDFALVANAVANYTNVQVDVSFWDIATNAQSGTGAAFTNRLASYSISMGARNYASTGIYYYTGDNTGAAVVPPFVSFSTPFTYSSASNVGMQMLVRADTGTGLVGTQNLDPSLQVTAAPTVGTMVTGVSPTYGFYRNASQPAATNADTSMLGSDFRFFAAPTTNACMAFRLYSQGVPEPASFLAVGIGLLALAARRRK